MEEIKQDKWILCKEVEFDAGHYLRNYEGKCANMHGHRWKVIVEIEGDQLNEQGMVLDFGEIKRVIMKFDHQMINDIEPFTKLNPTAENLAKYFCDVLKAKSVTVYETPSAYAKYIR